MGTVLSLYQNAEQTNLKEEITDNDEFHDAVDELEATDTMNLENSENQENLVTDAVESNSSPIFVNTSNITYETIAEIEKQLEYYEKVSLVFLLYEQEDNALQSLLVEHANNKHGSSTNLLSDWAKSKHQSSSSWQDRFVEALCVVQNYALLRQLGFDKNEMEIRYLPIQPVTALHLNPIMKALYCICDQLSASITKSLIEHLENDFRRLNLEFQVFGENHLEMYLLHCFSMKYITKNDLSNLTAILKTIGLISKADMLDSILNKTSNKKSTQNLDEKKSKTNFDLTKPTENYQNHVEPNCSDYSVIHDSSIDKVKTIYTGENYEIDPNHVGICLIINQKTFYREEIKLTKITDDSSLQDFGDYCLMAETKLEERTGSEIDGVSLSRTFSKLGFRIVQRENLNHKEVISTIQEFMGIFSQKDSCFVVCIMSHGVKEKIYAANSIPVYINDIKDTLHDRKYINLLGKPKLLIIQSCQGQAIQKVYRPITPNDLQTDGPSNNNDLNVINDASGVPEKCDLLLCMSTVSGFASVRSPSQGSWYIQELCNKIDEKCEEDHFQDILTAVHHEVINKRWSKVNEIVTMVPEFTTSLSKKLYLRKVRKLI